MMIRHASARRTRTLARAFVLEGLNDLAFNLAADAAEERAVLAAIEAEREAWCPARPYSDSWYEYDYDRRERERARRNANLPTHDVHNVASFKEEDRDGLIGYYVDLYRDKYGFKPWLETHHLSLSEIVAMLNDLERSMWHAL